MEDDTTKTTDDIMGNALVALNHLATITDDLYSLVGDTEVKLSEDDYVAILNSYEILSGIYDKYEGEYDLPSNREYDIDAYDEEEVNVTESTETIVEAVMEDDVVALAKKNGFSEIKQSADTVSKAKIKTLYGLKMRAGKTADVYFAVYKEDDQYKCSLIGPGGEVVYKNWESAKMGISKMVKQGNAFFEVAKDEEEILVGKKEQLKESTILTWDRVEDETYMLAILGEQLEPSVLESILEDIPAELFEEGITFYLKENRDAAIENIVTYFTEIKELDINKLTLGNITESFDEAKFRRLAITGLVPDADIVQLIRAMKQLDQGKPLSVQQKDLVSTTFASLISLVTGDTSVFSKIQGAAKKAAASAEPAK